MMRYKNTKALVRSPDGDTDFFKIVVGVQQKDTLAPYTFIICLNCELRTSIDLIKENGFTFLKRHRSGLYLAEAMTDAVYADDLVLLVSTPTLAESLFNSLEQIKQITCSLNKTEPSPL